jgi:uncharacterized protein (DUF983 family)
MNMVTKGWYENCQFQNRNGVYCSQCGEELQNKRQPDIKIMFVGLAIVLACGRFKESEHAYGMLPALYRGLI